MCFLRFKGRALPDCGCPAPRSWPHRLRGIYLGYPGRPFLRPGLHRLSFSTDLQERDIIFGGEEKLYRALTELIERHDPKAAFVYSTCIVGIIGDDLEAVCRRVAGEKKIPVLPVQSEGFKGNKREGYSAACKAMFRLVGTGDVTGIPAL